MAASRHPALSLGSNTRSWALQMCSWHAPGAASLLGLMSACLEHTNTSICIQTNRAFRSRSPVTAPWVTWRGDLGGCKGDSFQVKPDRDTYTPNTLQTPTYNPKDWTAELIQRKTPPEIPAALTLCSQHHQIYSAEPLTQCSVTQNPRILWAGRNPPSEPLQLCFTPTHPNAFTCFSCLVLQWSALRDNPSAFIACNCNSSPNRAFVLPAQDVWIKQN